MKIGRKLVCFIWVESVIKVCVDTRDSIIPRKVSVNVAFLEPLQFLNLLSIIFH